MQPLSRVRTDELSSLVMENELLRYEVVHLRARLAAADKAVARAGREVEALKAPGGDADTGGTPWADVVWLLRRIDASPVGRVLGRGARMADLRRRYLGETPR